MFFAISKIFIEIDQSTKYDLKDLTSLCRKIQSRYQVCAKPLAHTDEKLGLAVALLASSRNSALQKLDQIVQLTEESGIGRVENEISLVDHVDAFADEDEDDGNLVVSTEAEGDDETDPEIVVKRPDDAYKLRH